MDKRHVNFRRDGSVSVNGLTVGSYMNLGTEFRFESLSGRTFVTKTRAELIPYALATRNTMET